MPSTVAVLGPFSGGLNKTSDASAIANNELSELVNLDVDYDGSLVCRPPMCEIPYNTLVAGEGGVGGGIAPPVYVDPSPGGGIGGGIGGVDGGSFYSGGPRNLVIGTANINSISYLLVSNNLGIWAFKKSNDSTDEFEIMDRFLIHGTLRSDCAIQLHNVIYILATPNSPSKGGTWDGTTFTPDATDVRGSSALFFKGRVWVTPGVYQTQHPKSSQLVLSDPVPLTLPITVPWNPVNIIPVGQGDGENLVDMLVVADNLMLFKNNSTYAYLYDVAPNDGILRKVNNNIGASAQFCVLTHENEAYVYHEGSVYQISNYTFVEASIKMIFEPPSVLDDRREKVALSLLGNTLLVRYFDRMYALNLKTKTWSEWQSDSSNLNSVGRILKLEYSEVSTKLEGYYGGSVLSNNINLVRIRPGHTALDREYDTSILESGFGRNTFDISCSMTTKIFDFTAPHVYKRLMWWGVDVISSGNLIGIANPVTQTGPVTWDNLTTYTWDQLYAWNNLLSQVAYVETDIEDPFVIRRKFMKLLKSLRFRQIAFTIKLKSDGRIAEEDTLGPARIFTLSAIVGIKQTVVKPVS